MLNFFLSVFQINCVLFIFLLHRINRVSKLRDRMTRTQHLRAWLRRSSVLLPVLGITWSFGFLTYISSTTLFHYLFTVCNTLQGFIIFVNFCIIDAEVSFLKILLIMKITQTAVINIVFQRVFCIDLDVSFASQHTFSKVTVMLFENYIIYNVNIIEVWNLD